jgi:uncharacterized protein (DUF952 family)
MADNAERIYHIAWMDDWMIAEQQGWYEAPSLGSEGFIHCSYKSQVVDTATRYYAGTKCLLLLEIDPAKLESRWVAEKSTGDALYPHVYGRINLDAVSRVASFEPQPDGSFLIPEELG